MRATHLFIVAVIGVMLTTALAMMLMDTLWTSPGWTSCDEQVGALLLQSSCGSVSPLP